jgi:hypothetical protein
MIGSYAGYQLCIVISHASFFHHAIRVVPKKSIENDLLS